MRATTTIGACCLGAIELSSCGQGFQDLPPIAQSAATAKLFSPQAGPTPVPVSDSADIDAVRQRIFYVLDHAEGSTMSMSIHDACLRIGAPGDWEAVPHLIRALRAFPDVEPGPGVGIECTEAHCVEALQKITGARPGLSYSAWHRWYEGRQARGSHQESGQPQRATRRRE